MTTTLTATGITFNDATSQTTTGVEIPTGTLMLFQQTAAPTGWTKQTTHNNKALRVVSGTASSGGSVAFTTAFAANSVGATTISTAQMPNHSHSIQTTSGNISGSDRVNSTGFYAGYVFNTDGAGGGSSHTHSFQSLEVQYVDLIIASKN